MKTYKQRKSIPTEIIQLWETAWKKCSEGGEEAVLEINLPNRAKAMTFRQHLYTVKNRLIEENYLGANNFEKLVISVPPENGGNTIYFRLQPWLKGVKAALEAEGVKPDHGPSTIEPTVQEQLQPNQHVEMLKELFGPQPQPTREESHE